MLYLPGFDYGTGPTLVRLTIPQRPWVPMMRRVGGHRTLASGIPLGRTIRRDHLLEVALRLYETEWLAVQAMVAWAQDQSGTGAAFLFRPDTSQAGVSVYLEEPQEELRPTRGGFPGELEARLVLRKAAGTPWDLNFYG